MICVLVAHLNVDHNLPAQGDIASFSFHWSGLFALAVKKNSSSQIHVTVIKNIVEGESTAKGPIKALRVRPISRLMLEMFWLKAHTHKNKTIKKNPGF